MRFVRSSGLHLLAALLLSLVGAGAAALNPDRGVHQFSHSKWTAAEGAPAEAWDMAQTVDGWLWFGTPSGLYRFDGVRFERLETLPSDLDRSSAISSLLALDTGELWIGYQAGGVSVLRNGQFTFFGPAEGVPRGTVRVLEQDAEGTLWAAVSTGLLRLGKTRWHAVGEEWGLPPKHRAQNVHVDGRGAVWVNTDQGLFRLESGTRQFKLQKGLRQRDLFFFDSPDGRSWHHDATDARSLGLLEGQPFMNRRARYANASNAIIPFFDRDGGLWYSRHDTVYRSVKPDLDAGPVFPDGPRAQTFAKRDGLSGWPIYTMMEDRQGHVWISTGAGVDRFGDTRMVPLPLGVKIEGRHHFVVGGKETVWIASDDNRQDDKAASPGLLKHDGQALSAPAQSVGEISASYRDHAGVVWLATRSGIWRQEGATFQRWSDVPTPYSAESAQSIVADARGDVWLSINRHGVFRVRAGVWEEVRAELGLPEGVEAPLAQALDAQGGHWFGYHDNTLAVRHSDNTTTVYTRADGLRVANVSAISLGRYTLAGGPKGLALLAGSRFVMIRATDPAALQSAFSVAEAPNGDVWINTLRGAERIASAEMQALVKDAGRRVRVQYFDAQDGYPGPGASSVRYWNRTVVALDNGVVWFAGREGIARISAAGLDDHGKPPSVVVRSLTAAQRRYDLSSPVHLPKGTDQVQIDYTALASLRPDRLRFRYRLQGVDKAWVEADGRRQAFYVNLGPGSYRFEVTAAEGFEDWVATPAAFEFHIEYRFVETRTFLALGAAGVAVLLFAGYRLRVRRLTERERSRTQLRMLERERIARDLHDTLLQSVTGLALQIHATARQLPEDSPQRASLQHVLSRANSTIVEGRDRVRELRGGTTVGSSLTEALRTAAADITHENPAVRLTVLEEGRPEPLKDSVRDEAFCIAREAMTNAVRHGNPDAVDISVRYASAELVVCVRDDGSGIPPQVLDAGARAGHWGLAGMAERAGRLGARLELSNRPEGGTQVLLRVPAARAFGRCRLRPWRRMRRGF